MNATFLLRFVNILAAAALIASLVALYCSWQELRSVENLPDVAATTYPPSIKYLELEVKIARLRLQNALDQPSISSEEIAASWLYDAASKRSKYLDEQNNVSSPQLKAAIAKIQDGDVPAKYRPVIIDSLRRLEIPYSEAIADSLQQKWELPEVLPDESLEVEKE